MAVKKIKIDPPVMVHEPGLKRSFVLWNGIKIWFYHTGYADGGREVRFHPDSEMGPAVRLNRELWEEKKWRR